MVVEVKPAHIRVNMVKCTTAGMVKLTALGMVSTTMNALASTITLAKVPEEEEVEQAEEPLLVEQQAAEVDIAVHIMDSNGTVPTVELTHGDVVDMEEAAEVAEQLKPPPLQLPPLVKNRDNGLDNKA